MSKFVLGVLWGLPATAVLLFIVYLSLKHSLTLLAAIGLGVTGLGFLSVYSRVDSKEYKNIRRYDDAKEEIRRPLRLEAGNR